MSKRVITLAMVLCIASVAFAGGSGAVPISSRTTISQPGSYILVGNVVEFGSLPSIDITAPNVTLNLNGFSISPQSNSLAIRVRNGASARIFNGTITGGSEGIRATSAAALVVNNVRFSNMTANAITAVDVSNAVIDSCQVANIGGVGFDVQSPGAIGSATITRNAVNNATGGVQVFRTLASVIDNQLNDISIGFSFGGIVVIAGNGGLIERNTIRNTGVGVPGIFLTAASFGLSVNNNTVDLAGASGIQLDANNCSLNGNVVNRSAGAGIGIGLSAQGTLNRLNGNTMNANTGFGMRFGPTGSNNLYESNVGRGNGGTGCGAGGATAEFCDESTGVVNTSTGTNYLPGPS